MRVLAALLLVGAVAPAQEAWRGAADLDAAVEAAVAADEIPGAVVMIGDRARVLHLKAYGARALVPAREPMTVDTIFDAASLTKVVATTSSIMRLFEQGKLRLNDRVTQYLPDFQGGQSDITLRQLLTHFSGLRPDVDLTPAWSGYATGIGKALVDKPMAQPGERFIYSDINFILLGEIVRKLAGKPLPVFAREQIFQPLEMGETTFQPPAEWRARIAPTEWLRGEREPLRGVVHDETTRFMGGVAGHAGLFTTAEDLSHFARMVLDGGMYQGKRVFSPLTLRKFTSPQTPPGQTILRGLGWDIDSQYSSNRGELLPIGSFGHTGFTGTSLWIDPETGLYVILLSNSVHPHRRAPIAPLRSKVATIAAAASGVEAPGVTLTGYNETLVGPGARRAVGHNTRVETGIDVLRAERFSRLKGKRVGLITNHTGQTRDGRRNIDVMLAGGVRVVKLFSPEHGFGGREDQENIGHTKDAATGLPVYSLYEGSNRRPNEEMLKDIDVLVFDIQDIGARFYTYMCTMAYAMEEASKRKLPFWVLDRPNPITGVHMEGPMLEEGLQSFVGCFPMPLRHGMTMGEIARMIAGERRIEAALTVVPMKHWKRGDWFDSTGLTWIDPSPNMRSLNAALLYPGVAMMELARNYSVGRGTDAPFEQIGADWIDGQQLASVLNGRHIPGVRVYATRFRPTSSNLAGKDVEGVRFVVTDRERFNSGVLGLELACAIEKLYPGKIDWRSTRRLVGSEAVIASIRSRKDPRIIAQDEEAGLEAFLEIRKKYLLYR